MSKFKVGDEVIVLPKLAEYVLEHRWGVEMLDFIDNKYTIFKIEKKSNLEKCEYYIHKVKHISYFVFEDCIELVNNDPNVIKWFKKGKLIKESVHIKRLNEMYESPILSREDIENMIVYISDFAEKNDLDILKNPSFDPTYFVPGLHIPSSEDNELDYNTLKLFNQRNEKILVFSFQKRGDRYINKLLIGDSKFENIKFETLRKIIED